MFWEECKQIDLSLFIFIQQTAVYQLYTQSYEGFYFRCSFLEPNDLNLQFRFLPLGVAQFCFKLTLSGILNMDNYLIIFGESKY